MVECRECSTDALVGDTFCRQCGNEIEEHDVHTCDCGVVVREGDKFCHSCGAEFEGVEEINEEEYQDE